MVSSSRSSNTNHHQYTRKQTVTIIIVIINKIEPQRRTSEIVIIWSIHWNKLKLLLTGLFEMGQKSQFYNEQKKIWQKKSLFLKFYSTPCLELRFCIRLFI